LAVRDGGTAGSHLSEVVCSLSLSSLFEDMFTNTSGGGGRGEDPTTHAAGNPHCVVRGAFAS
jgi:hypothetical protein